MKTQRFLSLSLAALPLFAAVALAQFPAERVLTDSTGRKLEATVLSESGDKIRIRRKSDGKEFDIELNKISAEDRAWLNSLLEKKKAMPDGPSPEPRPVAPERPPLRPVPQPAPIAPRLIPSKSVLAAQAKAGLVPPPPGWDALETTIRFKDGKETDGYVYDVRDGLFWYAARDMVQKSASLDELEAHSRVGIVRWRSRSMFAGSPSVALKIDGKAIHASVIEADDAGVTLLTEAGEFMERVPVASLDADARKFLDAWLAGTWEPKETEWAVAPKFTDARPPFRNGHALVRTGGKWGVVDRAGEFVVAPRYDDVVEIRDSPHLKVREDGKWGLMADGARLALPPAWEDVGDLHQGLIPVRSGGKWGYAEDGGRLVIPCTWDDAWRFSSAGSAVVTLNGKRGFVDRSGKVIVEPEWDGAIMHTPGGVGAVRRGKGWALIDREGKPLCEPVWDFRWQDRRFELGYIPARAMRVIDTGTTLLGIDGKPYATPKLRDGVCLPRQPGPFLGVVPGRTKFTLADKEGDDMTFDEISATRGGLAAVRQGNKWGFADGNGLLLEPRWDRVGGFSEGLAGVVNWGEEGRSSDIARWPWEFIDATGKTVIGNLASQELRVSINTSEHPWAPKIENGRISARDARWGQLLISDKGTILSRHRAEMPAPGKLFPKVEDKPDKIGLIDTEGRVLFKPELDRILTGSSHWIGIKVNGKWGLADRAGQVVVEPFTASKFARVIFPDNGSAVIGIGTRERIYWSDRTQLKAASENKLQYFDEYGSRLVLVHGEGDAREWWIAQQEPPALWKLEGVRRIYWNRSLAAHDRIWLEDRATRRWHFCSIDGKRLGPEMAGQPSQWFFDDGMGIMRDGDSCHFINKDGQTAGAGTWEDARVFRNGMAAVKRGGLWGFIDKTGKIRIDCGYDEVGDFFVASGKSGDGAPLLAAVSKAGRWGYIDPKGALVIPMEHDSRGNWQYGKVCFSSPRSRWEITAAYEPDGKRYEGNPRQRVAQDEPAKHRHAGTWSITRGDAGMRGLVSDTGTVALGQEWRVIAWVAPGVVAVRNKNGGGLFSPEKGWLFRENDQQRILRAGHSGGFAHDFLRDGLIVIEETPKWGYARYVK